MMSNLERGRWELSDGTVVERGLIRRRAVRERFMLERSLHPTADSVAAEGEGEQAAQQEDDLARAPNLQRLTKKEAAELAAREQERGQLGLTRSEYAVLRELEDDAALRGGFSIYDLPLLILLPLLGAALGLVTFAGFGGGFLVASGSSSPSYSRNRACLVKALHRHLT